MRKLNSIIEAQQLDLKTIEEIFKTASQMEKKCDESLLKGKIMATIFYEPSTRTRLSFESAMERLGGQVISTENAKEFSSKAKGESLEDSIRVISEYCDVIALRYHKEGGAKRARNCSNVPIINAGDGSGQHPTQALLDLYTIKKAFGKIKDLNIAMVGDLANGRTVRSLCYLLGKIFPENKIIFVSPEEVRMKDDIKKYLKKQKISWSETSNLNMALSKADVVYQTRIQTERFFDKPKMKEIILKKAEKFVITEKELGLMKKNAIIMHPLPRVNEISYLVDKDKRALYFKQAKNGLYIRMALLKMILIGY